MQLWNQSGSIGADEPVSKSEHKLNKTQKLFIFYIHLSGLTPEGDVHIQSGFCCNNQCDQENAPTDQSERDTLSLRFCNLTQ